MLVCADTTRDSLTDRSGSNNDSYISQNQFLFLRSLFESRRLATDVSFQISSRRRLIDLTIAGSRCEKKLLAPVSSFAMRVRSESSSLKSKILRFSAMRSFRTDLASDTTLR